MPETNGLKQVLLDSFGAAENGESNDSLSAPVMDDSAGSDVQPVDVAAMPDSVDQENQLQDPSSIQVEQIDSSNMVLLSRGDSLENDPTDERLTEDGGKEDMFVDCPDELIVSDNKDALIFQETKRRSEDYDDMKEAHVHELDNGTQNDGVMNTSNELKDEKDVLITEFTKLHHQLKALNCQQPFLNGNEGAFVDGLLQAEAVGMGKNFSTNDMVMDCSKFVRNALDVRLQMEREFRKLQALLSMKDQEIEDLHAKVSELSISHIAVLSFLRLDQSSFDSSKASLDVQDGLQHIEASINRVLSSFAPTVNEAGLLDDSITGKLFRVEKNTSLLIENYYYFLSEIDLLRQSLSEVRSGFNEPEEFGTTFAAARNMLLELKRQEVDFAQKISNLEEENKELVEQLGKGKEMTEIANAYVEKLKVELEQEKARYSNCKEKLSLAVTKGKALVQQRESLKQSLAEKTSELEKCLTELQEKSLVLEAADLVKEELARTENLAASLQEALSQRDNTLSKCEEILYQTSVHNELQSADIMETIRCLVDEKNKMAGVMLEFNKLVDVLSSIDLPENVSSSDPESRVVWLVDSFALAKGEVKELQDHVTRTSDVAHKEIERLTILLSAETQEKNYIREELEDLTHKYNEIVEKEYQLSMEKDRMVSMLLEASGTAVDSQEDADQCIPDVRMLIDRCLGKIKEQSSAFSESSGLEADFSERMQTLLYIKYQELMLCEELLEEDIAIRSKLNTLLDELEIVSQELQSLKDEKSALERDLERSDEKTALLREKLSMAVKKGKGLVQDRENLKKLMDEKTAEIEKLKLELQQHESVLDDCRNQITKLSTTVELIPKLEADLTTTKDHKDQLEQFLVESNNVIQRVMESIDGVVLPIDSTFEEPVEKVQWLLGYLNECSDAKIHVEEELENLKVEVSTLSSKLTDAYTTKRSLEEALSSAENSISQLGEEKRELEAGKTHAEQELHKVLEEASSAVGKLAEVCATRKLLEDSLLEAENKISVLINEKEDAQVSMAAAETELEKVKEEVSVQTTRLAEAYRTINSLEDALSHLETNVSLLSKENNNAQVDRTNLENEMKKLKEESEFQATKLADASSTIRSLEDALFKGEDNLSKLGGERVNAELEISELNSKLNACMQELAGIGGNLESRSVELSSHLNNLQLLYRDDILPSLLKQSFGVKFQSLRDMDLLLEDIREHFLQLESESLQTFPVTEEASCAYKFSDGLDNIANLEVGNVEGYAEDGDSFESCFRRTVEGIRFGNKTLVDKVRVVSSSMDEFIAALSKKVQAIRGEVVSKLDQVRSLEQKVNDLETGREAQELKIAMSENDVTILLSVCTAITQELEIEVEKSQVELSSVPELEKLTNLLSEVREVRCDAVAVHQQDNRIYVKSAENLLMAAKKVCGLTRQLERERNVSADAIKDLEIKITESKVTVENAVEERDLLQNRISNLESELEALQNTYQEMRIKVEDDQGKEAKLGDREAEISSLRDTLAIKEKEAEEAFLVASQLKSIYNKINDLEIPFTEFKVEGTVFHDSDCIRKVFYIIDAVASMQHEMKLLSQDKEDLLSTIAKQVHQIELLKEEVGEKSRGKQDLEKMKNDIFELELGMETIIQKLGGNNLVGDQKIVDVRGLLTVLENLVMGIVLESDKSKSRAQELGAKFVESQRVVDVLSAKVKLLEASNHGGPSSEGSEERNIFETPPLPTRSEITELEDVGHLGKKAVGPAPYAPHARTLRKGSNDHLAINIDSESDRLIKKEEIDEDKGKVFKSLNTSGLIPIQGKMIADRIDGFWVSGDRTLMTHPRARLGLIAYWLLLHIWLLGTIL